MHQNQNIMRVYKKFIIKIFNFDRIKPLIINVVISLNNRPNNEWRVAYLPIKVIFSNI